MAGSSSVPPAGYSLAFALDPEILGLLLAVLDVEDEEEEEAAEPGDRSWPRKARRTAVWLQEGPDHDVAILYFETDDPGRVLHWLASSDLPYDRRALTDAQWLWPFDPLDLASCGATLVFESERRCSAGEGESHLLDGRARRAPSRLDRTTP